MKKAKRISYFLNHKGFTLLEILVSVAVLGILALLVAQIMTAISKSTKISNRQVDASSQARLVFDRIGMDLAALLKRKDADFQMENGSTVQPVLKFLSQVTSDDSTNSLINAANPNRGVSLISYAMRSRADNKGRMCLVRGVKAVDWKSNSFFGLKNSGTSSHPQYLYPIAFSDSSYPIVIVPADEDILSSAVFQFVVGVQLYPDNKPVYFKGAGTPSLPNARGQLLYQWPMRKASPDPGNAYVDLSRIASLVVGVVVTDLDSLKILDVTQAGLLTDSFSALPAQGELPLTAWMKATNDLAALPSSVPLPVRQAVRLYQRVYPITTYGSQDL